MSTANRLKLAATGLALAGTVAACAVVPQYTPSTATFQGHPVISSIPANPRGIVYLFHGTGGDAGFAERLETVDMLNHLEAAGYGFVSTDSTDRTTAQWDTSSLSLTANPDLARLAALHASLIASGRITATTPIEAIGMSRGAAFAAVFARAFHDAGYPVAAIAPSHGPIPASVRTTGGLPVPIFTALGANDPTIDDAQVVRQIAAVQAQGVPAQVTIEPETLLTSARFLRVDGVDVDTANAIYDALVDAGLWDRTGHRLVSIDAVEAALPGIAASLPLTADERRGVDDEIEVLMAVHQYSATYASQTVAWFDAHR
jgi:dienelactone hydrolase